MGGWISREGMEWVGFENGGVAHSGQRGNK